MNRIRRDALRAAVAAMVLSLIGSFLPRDARAQGLNASAAFGALTFPEIDPVIELSLNFDRFTDSTKLTDLYRLRHYALHRTYGLNTLGVSIARRIAHTGTIVRITGGVGRTGETPTKYFQNRFLHHFLFLDSVPVNPNHLDEGKFIGSLTAEANYWVDNILFHEGPVRWNAPIFLGGGATGSTLNHEAFAQAGLRSLTLRAGNVDLPAPSYMIRFVPWVHSSALYPRHTIARAYRFTSLSIRIPLDRWWDSHGVLPEIEWGKTSTTGLFMAADSLGLPTVPFPEKDCTIALHWAEGDFTAETYNDSCGDKDQGPTYGVRFYTRLRRPCDVLPSRLRQEIPSCRKS